LESDPDSPRLPIYRLDELTKGCLFTYINMLVQPQLTAVNF